MGSVCGPHDTISSIRYGDANCIAVGLIDVDDVHALRLLKNVGIESAAVFTNANLYDWYFAAIDIDTFSEIR